MRSVPAECENVLFGHLLTGLGTGRPFLFRAFQAMAPMQPMPAASKGGDTY